MPSVPDRLHAYVVPGVVFQSVIVGGGYGTGREVVHFVSAGGPAGGLFAVALVGVMFCLTLGLTLDFARVFRIRDYRSLIRAMLGRLWMVFEVGLVLVLVLVLAICGSSSGEVLSRSFGWHPLAGIGLMLLIILAIGYFGRVWVERTLTFWGILMTVLMLCYAAIVVSRFGDHIALQIAAEDVHPDWWRGGLRFFFYSALVIPTLVFTSGRLQSRKEAWGAGLVGGVLGVLPALLYHLTFLPSWPAILEEPLPVYVTIQRLGMPVLLLCYVVVLFGTIAQTGVGALHGVNERIDAWRRESRKPGLSAAMRSTVAGTIAVASMGLASFGIVELVAKGYGTLAWVGLFLFVLPLFTIGVWRLRRAGASP